MESFDKAIAEAYSQPFSGWDFSYIDGRYQEGEVRWDFRRMVLERGRLASSLLDLGTGGGEFLSSVEPLPRFTCATEGYPPNARLASARLKRVGVEIVGTFCEDNGGPGPQARALPFRSDVFDVVVDRHESYVADEVFRVLRRGGVFLTQQVGERNNFELRRRMHVPDTTERSWNMERAEVDLKAAGFTVVGRGEDEVPSRFFDIGALVYYLKAIPWEVPGFEPSRYRNELLGIHESIKENGAFGVTTSRFYLLAEKR